MFTVFVVIFDRTERWHRLKEFRRIGQKRARSYTSPLPSRSTIAPSAFHPWLLIQINIHHGK